MSPEVNFDTIPDAEDYDPIPSGHYHMRVEKVTEKQTTLKDVMFNMKLVIVEGEYEGRKVWDNITFSEKGMKRVKLVCSRLGIDVSGSVNVTPELLTDCEARVEVIQSSYSKDGKEVQKNEVTFAGYERLDGATVAAPASEPPEKKLPF